MVGRLYTEPERNRPNNRQETSEACPSAVRSGPFLPLSQTFLVDNCPSRRLCIVGSRIHIRPFQTAEPEPPPSDRPEYLPDPILTPGSVVLESPETVLGEGYAERNRRVSQKEKDKVFRRYRIAPKHRHGYQIDHLLPLSLGGSNDLRNLWPHPHHPTYGPVVKARLEACLRALVRRGIQPLTWAQGALKDNWVAALRELCLT